MRRLALKYVDRLAGRVWQSGPFAKKVDSLDIQEVANVIAALESARYYTKHMLNCKSFQSAADLLTYALSLVKLPGIFCEFGVASGKTINHIARVSGTRLIHGIRRVYWLTGGLAKQV
jgi:hypothetical protein